MASSPSNSIAPKVGLITLPGRFNYGNRLQCYAVNKQLVCRGFDVDVLALANPCDVTLKSAIKRIIKAIIGPSYKKFKRVPSHEEMSTPERLAAFAQFDTLMTLIVLKDLRELDVEAYRYFVTGSDQVWNPYFIGGYDSWYFLKFANRGQRVTVSPSIAIHEFADQRQRQRIAEGVKGFDRLSIREKRGAELIKECTGQHAEVLIDPTLSLTGDEWRTLASPALTPKEPYVFTYLLGGVGTEAQDVLDHVTDHGRIPVIALSDRQQPGEPDAGPAEFIDLIDNATHVITDSFHAAVFSMLMNTPLTITHREGSNANMFSRLDQLADTFCLRDKIYGDPSFDLKTAGEYPHAEAALAVERKRFNDYLDESLHV